ncbi:hypothetical protein NEISICOT_02554 [Neisseria sicca ATCC 29256]|uniref:Uncharacterized protein n=1 Tax=Neisseria sicca ATCC 29256 TaxID=547045 RepID=C6M7P2_NEISI|nr:hypothetical protein NEISICOT_02554 [Neisseria sicca ATCC 29256]
MYAFFKTDRWQNEPKPTKQKKMSGLKIYRLPSDVFRRPLSD